MTPCKRVAITIGEPAGIGPDIVVYLAQRGWPAELVVCGDPELLLMRAHQLRVPLELHSYSPDTLPQPQQPGSLVILPIACEVTAKPGHLDRRNSRTVLAWLERAAQGAERGEFAALITAPVHKAVLNAAGHTFTGHTEFLAQYTGVQRTVMLFVGAGLRVALATTHLPLKAVPDAITPSLLTETILCLEAGLRRWFAIPQPHLYLCGLNPHAGEEGFLGSEEITTIAPVVAHLRQQGVCLTGPLPADSLFQPHYLQKADAILAMYHDQGLAAIKARAFGHLTNVTLGLPFIRTSVDHGTALSLAGSGNANGGSLQAAVELALSFAERTVFTAP